MKHQYLYKSMYVHICLKVGNVLYRILQAFLEPITMKVYVSDINELTIYINGVCDVLITLSFRITWKNRKATPCGVENMMFLLISIATSRSLPKGTTCILYLQWVKDSEDPGKDCSVGVDSEETKYPGKTEKG